MKYVIVYRLSHPYPVRNIISTLEDLDTFIKWYYDNFNKFKDDIFLMCDSIDLVNSTIETLKLLGTEWEKITNEQ